MPLIWGWEGGKTSDVSAPCAHEALAGDLRVFALLCASFATQQQYHFAVGSVIAVTHVKPLWATASAPTLSLSHITRNPLVHFPQCVTAWVGGYNEVSC